MARVRTYSPKKSEIERSWRVIDADGETLGRLATRIATILRGKDKPTYTTHMSVGDNVIVINAEKVRVSGQKEANKTYYRHTQYPGGLRAVTLSTLREKHPERIIQNAVKGMLPHNRLGRQNLRRLHVYAGAEHPHEAQVRAGLGVVGQRKQAQAEAQALEAAATAVAAPQQDAPVVPPSRRRRRRAAEPEAQDGAPPETANEAPATAEADEQAAAPETTDEATAVAEPETQDSVTAKATDDETAAEAEQQDDTPGDDHETDAEVETDESVEAAEPAAEVDSSADDDATDENDEANKDQG